MSGLKASMITVFKVISSSSKNNFVKMKRLIKQFLNKSLAES